MDFSALNPLSTNSVSLAAGKNDFVALRKLLESGKNPNCNDNRGWTSLHVAAANDAFEAVQVLLECPITSALAETFEGHTALYLACRNKCSMRTISLLLKHGENVAEYASNEMVSPLHVVCCQGRMDAAEALIAAGSLINLQDYDGDSPLHEAARRGHAELSSILLHVGADPGFRNAYGLSPFLLACFRGSIDCVRAIFPFVIDVNECAYDGNTGLILAAQRGALEVAIFLLENNANPDLVNDEGDLPLYMALVHGHAELFKLLLPVTNAKKMKRDLMYLACKPLYFSMDILITLLESDLGPGFFNKCDKFYITPEKIFEFRPRYSVNPPFCYILNVIEYIYKSSGDLYRTLIFLFLTKGVAVNPLYIRECPPLVYLHYTEHINCYEQVIDILIGQDCDVDYSIMPMDSTMIIPDAIIASITSGGHTLPVLLTYSLKIDPEELVEKLVDYNFIGQRISAEVMLKILPMCCLSAKVLDALHKQLTLYLESEKTSGSSELLDLLRFKVPSLKHICRKMFRKRLRCSASTTKQFLYILRQLPLPISLKLYLRYL